MKKWALMAATVAAAAVSAVAVSGAFANGGTIVAESTGFACGIFNASGGIEITTNSRSYLLENGKEVLHCQGQTSGADGTVHLFEGFACGMVFTGISTDPNNNNRVSKSGWSQLWCYNRASDAAAPSGGAAGALG
jgi:hypothetical protein